MTNVYHVYVFPILIQFHILSYLYHMMCTKRTLNVQLGVI